MGEDQPACGKARRGAHCGAAPTMPHFSPGHRLQGPGLAAFAATAALLLLSAGATVGPFVCEDPSVCVDGYVSEPSFTQCVAFGRDFTTSIEVKDPDAADRNEAWFMAGGTKTVVKFSGDFTPLMWYKPFLKFKSKCTDYAHRRKREPMDSALLTKDLREICDLYEDPVTKKKTCKEMLQDNLCVGSGQTLDIIHEVAMALTLPDSNSEATRAVRSCSCLP